MHGKHGLPLLVLLAGLALPSASTAEPAAGAIGIEADLRDAPRRVFHARLTMPVEPGPLTLHYPKWIPGEHGPTGPISDLAGLRIEAGGRPVAWRRDPLDMYTFEVDVPEGASQLEIRLDYLTPSGAGIFTHGPATSDRVAVMSWNTLLLYPAGRPSDEILFAPSLRLPEGWGYGCALDETGRADGRIDFAPVSLTTLVDSPVAAGAHHRVFPLSGDETVAHRLHVVADSEAALAMTPETHADYRALVSEGLALFGAHHYREYDFLLTLSDHVTSFGLEHHESSDNRLPERTLIDEELLVESAGLLPHEFVHSWNAKYRRPAGLTIPDYQTPFVDDLLWVYEGLTSYLGWVLTARSGLWEPEYARDALALLAAGLDHRPGREWRPLADTTRAAQVLFGARSEGSSWRRGVDFYDEGVLIWLEADTVVRRRTQGRHSLDDFCRVFHGGESGPPEVEPFTLDEMLASLGEVAQFDWRGFFHDRVETIRPEAPLGGVVEGGWKLVYTAEMNRHQKSIEKAERRTDLRFSLGLILRDEGGSRDHGRILDAIPGMPGAEAGVAPGMKLLAVNGRRWSPEILRRALGDAADGGGPLTLLVENSDFFATFEIDYRGGERYPHLERDEARPDLLSAILRPRTTASP